MSKTSFGVALDGAAVDMYTLKNAAGWECDIVTIGAALRALRIPDKDGKVRDILLGYDTVADYQNVRGYIGAVIGRRIRSLAKELRVRADRLQRRPKLV